MLAGSWIVNRGLELFIYFQYVMYVIAISPRTILRRTLISAHRRLQPELHSLTDTEVSANYG